MLKNRFIIQHPELKNTIIQLESLELFQGKLTIIDFEHNNLEESLVILNKYFGNKVDNITKNKNAALFSRMLFLYGDYSQKFGSNYVIANDYNSLSDLCRSSETEKSKKAFNIILDVLRQKSLDELEKEIETTINKNSWLYYFAKYPLMSELGTHIRYKNSFNLRLLKNVRITGWWTDPYLYIIKKSFNESKIVYENQIYDVPKVPLIVNNCSIIITATGWSINISDDSKWKNEYIKLCAKYNITNSELRCSDTQDRIEICKDVIQDILAWK